MQVLKLKYFGVQGKRGWRGCEDGWGAAECRRSERFARTFAPPVYPITRPVSSPTVRRDINYTPHRTLFSNGKYFNGLKLFSSVAKVVKKYGGSGDNQPSTSGTSPGRGESNASRPVRAFCARMADRIQSSRNRQYSEPILNRIIPAGMQELMSKFKCNNDPKPNTMEGNPIQQYFDLGPEIATAGHALVWKVHRGYRKTDRKEVSIFICEKKIADKLFKQKRKDSILERIRHSVTQLEKWRHPKLLYIVHSLEESDDSLAFATEPIIASLHNILSYQESTPIPNNGLEPFMPYPHSLTPGSPTPAYSTPPRPPLANSYEFCELELCYGIMQMIDGLHFMHYTAKLVHRNLCPQVIMITKRGTWKLFGLEFAEDVGGRSPLDPVPVAPWSLKVARIAQPHLDYMAPEIQAESHCTILSDIYSLGLVICTIYNHGKSIISANNNPILFLKQAESLEQHIIGFLPRLPVGIKEAVQRMLSWEPTARPTTQLLPLIHFFKDYGYETIIALQLLDMIGLKDREAKKNYYRHTLTEALPNIPKRMRWATVWPYIVSELRCIEMSPYVFFPVIWFVNDTTPEEFEKIIFPVIRACFRSFVNDHRKLPFCVVALENLHYIMKKCSDDEVNVDILPLVYKAMEDPSYQLQLSALICLQTASEHILDRALGFRIIPKIKQLIEKNPNDTRFLGLALGVYELNAKRLDKTQINDLVLPALLIIKLTDPDIVFRCFNLLRDLINEPKFGISTTTMATKLIPRLAPATVNNALNLEQFSTVMEVLYQMMDFIDQQQRIMITRPPPPSPMPDRHKLHHQMSNDNEAPPFNIPNLRVEQRKTSSAEEMARKNSVTAPPTAGTTAAAATTTETVTESFKKIVSGSSFAWIFGSNSSTTNNPTTSNDNNYLRVSNVFTNRRLSDNTLITPKIRVAPSCASSPGGTPGGPNSALPARRHSSIGPQERRGSGVNLSPPTAVHHHRGRAGGSGSSLSVPSTSHVGGSMPNTSSSVPYLLTSSMQSVRSRRSSAGVSASGAAGTSGAGSSVGRNSQGSQGLLQQLSAGVARRLPVTPNHPPKSNQWTTIQGATTAGYNALRQTASTAVRKCPSLNISLAN